MQATTAIITPRSLKTGSTFSRHQHQTDRAITFCIAANKKVTPAHDAEPRQQKRKRQKRSQQTTTNDNNTPALYPIPISVNEAKRKKQRHISQHRNRRESYASTYCRTATNEKDAPAHIKAPQPKIVKRQHFAPLRSTQPMARKLRQHTLQNNNRVKENASMDRSRQTGGR